MFHLSVYPFEGWTDRRMDYSTSLSIALADRRVGIRPTLTVTNRPRLQRLKVVERLCQTPTKSGVSQKRPTIFRGRAALSDRSATGRIRRGEQSAQAVR